MACDRARTCAGRGSPPAGANLPTWYSPSGKGTPSMNMCASKRQARGTAGETAGSEAGYGTLPNFRSLTRALIASSTLEKLLAGTPVCTVPVYMMVLNCVEALTR